MCRKNPLGFLLATLLLPAGLVRAQEVSEWRRIGNSAIELGLPSVATGPVDRVWYSGEPSVLYAETHSGLVYRSADTERWTIAPGAVVPAVETATPIRLPEPSSQVRPAAGGRLYAIGTFVYRSDDGGLNWTNLTRLRGKSLLGGDLQDLAVSPADPDELAVASATGVWYSADGGLSWRGLNQFLPNLPVKQILAVPEGASGLRIALEAQGAPELEWAPGERDTWQPSAAPELPAINDLKAEISRRLGFTITAVAASGSYVYAGSADGQIWTSQDGGASFGAASDRVSTPVEAIYIDPQDARIALAALGAPKPGATTRVPRVLRTMNAGIFWDDLSSNLPDAPAHGVTADPASGAVYVATDAGVFLTNTDLATAGRGGNWFSVSAGLPQLAAADVRLDAGGNQLFVALQGYGVYTAIAPHRIAHVQVVNAADYSARPAAPGGLLTVLGASIQAAMVQLEGGPALNAPVLAATGNASELQVPFEASGPAVSLRLQSADRQITLGLPLQTASPAIFVEPDGTPLIMDTESGLLLDASRPARAGSRIQILAAGLGAVQPDWQAGVAAPSANPPRVAAAVHVTLNSTPLRVTQAVLAPGYVGFYSIEAELPATVNTGPAELSVEVNGQTSNTVRLYVEP